MVCGLIFTAPFLASVVNGARSQTELNQITTVNNIASEAYNFLYTYKKLSGTVAFKQLIDTGNGGDCANNDLNQNGVTTDAVDGYCVFHLIYTGTGLSINHCAYNGGGTGLNNIQNISCKSNDASYPDAFYQ